MSTNTPQHAPQHQRTADHQPTADHQQSPGSPPDKDEQSPTTAGHASATEPVATVLGYPRQGDDRQLKRLTEAHWAGRLGATELLERARTLRLSRLSELADGLGRTSLELPSNDFSLYDHVLDTAWLVGAIPPRHREIGDDRSIDGRLRRYFAMARGDDNTEPLEMTKWFDTNYHYLVPELSPGTRFRLDAAKPVGEFTEARRAGFTTRPVILGPVSFLLLAKPSEDSPEGFEPLDLLGSLLPVYSLLLTELARAGADWVQLDEPVLACDQPPRVLEALAQSLAALTATTSRPRVLLAGYFDRFGESLEVAADSKVDGLAVDLTGPAAANLTALIERGGVPGKRLVAGVVSGRNIWSTDLRAALQSLESLRGLADRVDVGSSCSLLHVPLDVELESGLPAEFDGWFAFARQKLTEVATLRRGLAGGADSIASELDDSDAVRARRASSSLVHNDAVRVRAAAVTEDELVRRSSFAARADAQRRALQLPELPTTTIGSFPQTGAIRRARAALRRGDLTTVQYREAMRGEIADVIALQEELGLDVLVHGEPERNDMVQYFAEQLAGFVSTQHGWVQSYGSRYVRPPIIAGDVWRPEPMTVEWSAHAQSLTSRPVKGMLTGPVTMLAWSFVRDDQPEAETARQVALALREEVADLERAGIGVIQVDEPALRETLPLRAADRADYLAWAVDAFRLTTAGVADHTQVHTHMCYAEFGDVLDAIIAMDADVISLEAARSRMTILDALVRSGYGNEVGPGVWDIHSPRVPQVDEIAANLAAAVDRFGTRVWANPDCGLKTRGYAEVREALQNLVTATARVRDAEVPAAG